MTAQLRIPNPASFLLLDKSSTVTKIQLQPKSFDILRRAVADGMTLPASPREFEARYPRGVLQEFLERDPSVYEYVLQVYVATHLTCARFENVINKGLSVIDSAMALLGVRLNALVQEQNNGNIGDTLHGILQSLRTLSSDASDLSAKCESIEGDVAEFKVQSKQNYESAAKAETRWDKARVSDDEWQGKLSRRTEAIEDSMRRFQDEAENLDKQSRMSPPQSSVGWQIFRPFAEVISSIGGPRLRSREEIENDLEDLKRQFYRAQREAMDKETEFRKATNSIEALHHSMHDLSSHAEEVAAAISSVNIAASRLVTDNEDLARKLEYLRGDIEMEGELGGKLGDLLSSEVDEISECYAMWQEIRSIGEIMR
ncbi:uncharacterized protein FIESC28_01066 [Fusarium coffeatum]|uniref:Uncharacterized protein n=1 Tax=Fusarium coffeatum TaxID=231269 RepID=A0A366SAV0_9HYPO|nr:uncharacterized protein FIESC28_01066 [Fusarium coffeatum]RBR26038.1 hypothetical protein FIESC28_01066 [Fusarium coffeatum]